MYEGSYRDDEVPHQHMWGIITLATSYSKKLYSLSDIDHYSTSSTRCSRFGKLDAYYPFIKKNPLFLEQFQAMAARCLSDCKTPEEKGVLQTILSSVGREDTGLKEFFSNDPRSLNSILSPCSCSIDRKSRFGKRPTFIFSCSSSPPTTPKGAPDSCQTVRISFKTVEELGGQAQEIVQKLDR